MCDCDGILEGKRGMPLNIPVKNQAAHRADDAETGKSGVQSTDVLSHCSSAPLVASGNADIIHPLGEQRGRIS